MLDLGQATTSLSTDLMVQSPGAVSLKITLASQGLLHNLLFRPRGADNLGGRRRIGRSPFPSLI